MLEIVAEVGDGAVLSVSDLSRMKSEMPRGSIVAKTFR